MRDLTRKCYLIPYPSSGLKNLMDRLYAIHQIEKLDFIIPTLDSELFGFIKLESELASLGIQTFLPTLEQLIIRGKDKLFSFCSENDINAPKNILVTSEQDMRRIPDDFKFPVVIKGVFYEAYIANNLDEALTAFHKLRAKWGYPIIAQEFVRGDEFNVVALGDGRGGMVGAVPMRKTYITDKGKGWAGVTIQDSELLAMAAKVIERTNWRSGMELEFIKSTESGRYYLLEINPRFPAWVYLATAAGQNLPKAMVELALGKKITPFSSYEVGKIFVRSSWDLITDISVFEKITMNGEL
jgi:carbamoyl-phosphate synthase large subunit